MPVRGRLYGDHAEREACLIGGRGPSPLALQRESRGSQDTLLRELRFQVNGVIDPILAGILQESGLGSCSLTLELTESAMVENKQSESGILEELKNTGVKLAIDDFGTGYSSLSYLKRLPVEVVKLDRSIIEGVAQNSSDSAIVQATVTIACALGLEVIAEGVETEEQLAEVRALGCDLVQGYYFFRPLPGEEITTLLANGRHT